VCDGCIFCFFFSSSFLPSFFQVLLTTQTPHNPTNTHGHNKMQIVLWHPCPFLLSLCFS
jgi:hypothetical protein